MGQARHPLSLALAALAVGLAAATAGGCGSSNDTSTGPSNGGGAGGSTAPAGAAARVCRGAVAGVGRVRATGVGCAFALGVVASWDNKRACRAPAGGSRVSCSVEDYRCLGAATERGLAVTCAAPGRSIAFVAKRG